MALTKNELTELEELLLTRPRAPKPRGPLSGRRSRVRRLFARAAARTNELADFLLPSAPLHR